MLTTLSLSHVSGHGRLWTDGEARVFFRPVPPTQEATEEHSQLWTGEEQATAETFCTESFNETDEETMTGDEATSSLPMTRVADGSWET